MEIGITAGVPSYDPKRWYTSSEGFKSIITETISLGYEWVGKKDR